MLLDLFGGERLANIASSPTRYGLHHMGFTAFGGNHYYRNALGIGLCRELFHEFETIHYRHVDVAENQVNGVLSERYQSLSSIPSLQDLFEINASLAQATLHDLSHDRGIVHN